MALQKTFKVKEKKNSAFLGLRIFFRHSHCFVAGPDKSGHRNVFRSDSDQDLRLRTSFSCSSFVSDVVLTEAKLNRTNCFIFKIHDQQIFLCVFVLVLLFVFFIFIVVNGIYLSNYYDEWSRRTTTFVSIAIDVDTRRFFSHRLYVSKRRNFRFFGDA